VKDYTYVGERKEPNLELIRSVSPDLILAAIDRHKMIKNELQDIAPTLGLDDDSYQEVLKNTEMLGDLLGKKAEADKIKKDLEQKIDEVKQHIEGKPTVLVVGAFEEEFSVWVKDSFIGSLMSAIGVEYPNVAGKNEEQIQVEVAKLTIEELAQINPDYLFVYGDVDGWAKKPLFQGLKAAKENRVITVDRNLWSRGRGPIAASKILDEASDLFSKK
jgi:iron complex transport system substrate-binding protein